jgi:hypothetical protein
MNLAAFAYVFVYCDVGAATAGARHVLRFRRALKLNNSPALAAFRCLCNYQASSASCVAGA